MNTTANLPTFDPFSFSKISVGFEPLLKRFDEAFRFESASAYPPYNIVKVNDTNYVIEVALAGFTKEDVEITFVNDVLTIKGKQTEKTEGEKTEYLYKGIATRAFTRSFSVAENVEIVEAVFNDGVLKVYLNRLIPEEEKPKVIQIADKKTSSFWNKK